MTGAVIALALALAAAIALIAWFAYRNAKIADQREQWHTDSVATTARLATAMSDLTEMAIARDTERTRADGIHGQLKTFRDKLAAPSRCNHCGGLLDLSGFVLSLWRDDETTNPTNRDGSSAVHPRADADRAVLGDGLINPEE